MYYAVGLPFLEHQTTRLETAPGSQHCTSVCNLLHRAKPIIDPRDAARQSLPPLKQSQQNLMGLFHSCVFEHEYSHPLKFPFLSSALFLIIPALTISFSSLFKEAFVLGLPCQEESLGPWEAEPLGPWGIDHVTPHKDQRNSSPTLKYHCLYVPGTLVMFFHINFKYIIYIYIYIW